MALLNIFDIAGSALTAQSKRLNVAASNMANADSVSGPDGQPYRAKQVVFQVDAAPGAATGAAPGVMGAAGCVGLAKTVGIAKPARIWAYPVPPHI